MARQILNVGTTANDGTGDTLREAMIKTNENFTELYASPLLASGISVSGNEITATRSNDDLILQAAGTGSVVAGALSFKGTSISSTDSTIVNINEGLVVDGTLTATSFSGDGSAITGLSATALGDLTVVGSTIIAPSNADITLSPAGTGSIVLDAITINDNNITGTRSNDDINITPSGTGSVVFPAITINDNNITGTRSNDDIVITPSGTGSVVLPAITINDNNITGTRSNDDIVITPSGTGAVVLPAITINDNNITGTRSNENINITPAGTGTVVVNKLTIDSQIEIEDNEISTTQSNSDLVITPAGTGQVIMAKVDINGGAIDGATVGAASATTGVFTTLTANTSATVDGITLSDNEISTNESNANLELSGNGSGGVTISGFVFPTSDGTNGQFIKTNGAGVLSFATAGASLSNSAIADGTTTTSSSSIANIDTFDASTYRSAKYFISAVNSDDTRYEIFEANITHDGTNAYLTTFGSTTSGDVGLGTYSADISGGNVRLRVVPITSDDIVFKFQRIALNV